MFATIFLAVQLCNTIYAYKNKCSWENCPKWDHDKINIHLIAHTHNDLGWWQNFDNYYYKGPWETAPTSSGVKNIINTIVYELNKNESRRFSYAEIGYLKRWMDDYGKYGQDTIKRLVLSGQLEIISGGWVQADEASPHYVELIDMYTMSLSWLNETFGECGRPVSGWQIDPFGHSKEHANLLRLFGHEYLFLCREHFREHEVRRDTKSLQMNWRVSDDDSKSLLTEFHWNFNHQGPDGFCMESYHTMNCRDDPIIDSPKQGRPNVDQKVEKFMSYIEERMKYQHHNHVFVMMGDDFVFWVPDSYFTNMDKLMHHIRKRYGKKVNIFYSTPSCYYKAFSELKNLKYAEKYEDFFPYAVNEHAYWQGYFTSRPQVKGLARKTSSLLQLTRKIAALAISSFSANINYCIEEIERGIALIVGHDAITGTAKEPVMQDNIYNLTTSWGSAEKVIDQSIRSLSKKLSKTVQILEQKLCRRINESDCDFTRAHENFLATVYNSNSQRMTNLVRIPIYQSKRSYEIKDWNGQNVEYEIAPIFSNNNQLNNKNMSTHEISFFADIEPLGFQSYSISTSKDLDSSEKKLLQTSKSKFISNELIRLEFGQNGELIKYYDLETGKSYDLGQNFSYYVGRSNDKNNATWLDQPSGVYILRPVYEVKLEEKIKLEIIDGKIIKEARQVITPWVSQVIRLLPNRKVVEFEWTVGPIPYKDKFTKEVITRYSVNAIDSNGTFYTDSNGRQLMKRIRDYNPLFTFNESEPVAHNYYPLTNKILITDEKTSLAILTDRAHGSTSLEDGQVEIMLHRRCLYDDMMDMHEALNEWGHDGRGLVVRGKHWLILGSTPNVTRLQRTLSYELLSDQWITFSKLEGSQKNQNFKFSGLMKPLPENVNLLTLKPLGKDKILLRLEHIFQHDEDRKLSKEVVVDLNGLFATFKVVSIQEVGLAANKFVDSKASTNITLNPMEIKTFYLTIEPIPLQQPTYQKDYQPKPIPKTSKNEIISKSPKRTSNDNTASEKTYDRYYIAYLFFVFLVVLFMFKCIKRKRLYFCNLFFEWLEKSRRYMKNKNLQ